MSVSRKEIAAYWNENNPGRGWLGLWGAGEDICFCCGRESGIQKHHILPVATADAEELSAMSGAERRRYRERVDQLNRPSNLHLLCHRCHKLAPHTTDAEVYWRWFEHQPSFASQMVAAIFQGYVQAGATDYEADLLLKEHRPELLPEIVKSLDFCHTENDISTIVSSAVCKMVLDMRHDHAITKK